MANYLHPSSEFLDAYIDRFNLSEVHCDEFKPKIEIALKNLYLRHNLQAPLIIWTNDAMQHAHIAWFLTVFAMNSDKRWRKDVLKKVQKNYPKSRNSLSEKFYLFMDKLVDNLPSALTLTPAAELAHFVDKQLGERLTAISDNLFGSDCKWLLDEQLKERLQRYDQMTGHSPVARAAANAFFAERQYVNVQLPELCGISKRNMFTLMTFDCLRNFEPGIYPAELNMELDDLFTVLRGTTSCFLFDEMVIIQAKPVVLTVDDQNHLHNSVSSAYTTLSGKTYYFWHGVQISEKLFVNVQNLKPDEIDAQRNVAVRTALIEMYGKEKYFRKSRLERVHTDECGTLYRKRLKSEEPVMVVEVTNSTAEPDGSYKNYLLRVPPHIQRAKQAVAWTFGMDEEEYSIERET